MFGKELESYFMKSSDLICFHYQKTLKSLIETHSSVKSKLMYWYMNNNKQFF